MYDTIKTDFLGLSTLYRLKNGEMGRRHYLDSTASTLMMKTSFEVARCFLDHYSNVHSQSHYGARISSSTLKWAHDRVLAFVGADPDIYTCIFYGSGTTGCSNRVSQALARLRPDRNIVLTSLMEHHSNDLPHRKMAAHFYSIPLLKDAEGLGSLSLHEMRQMLLRFGNSVNYIAVSAASNVTGILNSIHDIAEMAHHSGTLVVVDGAQIIAHSPVRLMDADNPSRNIDAFIFSGHKAYAPGAPGVLVIRKDLLNSVEPTELGGGMVEEVGAHSYQISSDFPRREQAGTPNILGALMLATSLEVMDRVGMSIIQDREHALFLRLIDGLNQIEEIKIYGHPDLTRFPRVGTLAFNISGIDHGLVAAILNDFHNIAVRNGCFCAHPYVKVLMAEEIDQLNLKKQDLFSTKSKWKQHIGMVRASVGLYTTEEDIDALLAGIKDVIKEHSFYQRLYKPDETGAYIPREPPLYEGNDIDIDTLISIVLLGQEEFIPFPLQN